MSETNPMSKPDDATTPVPATATPEPATADLRTTDAAASAPGGVAEAGSEGAFAVEQRGPRTGTMVGALVLILLGVGVVAVGLGVRLDLQAALIALLVIAGTALLVGALLSARRQR